MKGKTEVLFVNPYSQMSLLNLFYNCFASEFVEKSDEYDCGSMQKIQPLVLIELTNEVNDPTQ